MPLEGCCKQRRGRDKAAGIERKPHQMTDVADQREIVPLLAIAGGVHALVPFLAADVQFGDHADDLVAAITRRLPSPALRSIRILGGHPFGLDEAHDLHLLPERGGVAFRQPCEERLRVAIFAQSDRRAVERRIPLRPGIQHPLRSEALRQLPVAHRHCYLPLIVPAQRQAHPVTGLKDPHPLKVRLRVHLRNIRLDGECGEHALEVAILHRFQIGRHRFLGAAKAGAFQRAGFRPLAQRRGRRQQQRQQADEQFLHTASSPVFSLL